jgi:hypothetical protein
VRSKHPDPKIATASCRPAIVGSRTLSASRWSEVIGIADRPLEGRGATDRVGIRCDFGCERLALELVTPNQRPTTVAARAGRVACGWGNSSFARNEAGGQPVRRTGFRRAERLKWATGMMPVKAVPPVAASRPDSKTRDRWTLKARDRRPTPRRSGRYPGYRRRRMTCRPRF